MSAVATRALHRELLVARMADNRSAIGQSLHQLARPLHDMARWKGKLLQLRPLLPAVVVITLLAWLLLRLLRGHDAARPAQRRSWLVLLQQTLGAWRLAMQCYALMQATRTATPQPAFMPSLSQGEQMR